MVIYAYYHDNTLHITIINNMTNAHHIIPLRLNESARNPPSIKETANVTSKITATKLM